MLCDKCRKNNATYHSSVNINGKISETHLCSKCAVEENKINGLKLFNFGSFFDDDLLGGILPGIENEIEEACPSCGLNYNTFMQTGLLGCGNCYEHFKSKLQPMINTMQNSTTHIGKKPEIMENLSENESKIKSLEYKLKQAVAEENYELASIIKKQINNLKQEEE